MKHNTFLLRRRWPWFLIGLIALLFVVGFLVEHLLPLDPFRAPIAEAIQKATGLPASVAELEADFLPYPRVEAHGVVLGEADFEADVKSVRVYAALFPLVQKRVEITEIELKGVRLTVPEALDRLQERLRAIRPQEDGESEEPKKAPGFVASIRAIEVTKLAIYHPGKEEPLITGKLRLEDVLSSVIAVSTDLDVTVLGDAATVRAHIRVKPPRDGSALEVSGRVDAADVNARFLARNENVPPLLVSLDANLKEVSGAAGAVTVNGRVAPGSAAGYDAAEGDLFASVALQDGGVKVPEMLFDGKALKAHGAASWQSGSGFTVELASLIVESAILQEALARIPRETVHMEASPTARLVAQNVSIAKHAEAGWQLSQGTLSLTGLNVTPPAGGPISGVGLEASLAENVLCIDALTLPEGEFSGTLAPSAQFDALTVDLAGELRLTPEGTAALIPTTMVQDVGGTATLRSFHAEIQLAGEPAADWRAAASFSEGTARIGAPGFVDVLEQIALDIAADPEAVRVSGGMQAAKHGPMTVDVSYALAERKVSGVVGLDLAALTLPLPPSGALERVNRVLDAYGRSDIGFTVPLPSDTQTQWALAVSREGAPGMTANLDMARDPGGGWRLAAVQASADAAPLAAAGPEGLSASGRLTVRHAMADGKTDLGLDGLGAAFQGHVIAEGIKADLAFNQQTHELGGNTRAAMLDANMIQPLADAFQGRAPEIPYRSDGTYGTDASDETKENVEPGTAAERDAAQEEKANAVGMPESPEQEAGVEAAPANEAPEPQDAGISEDVAGQADASPDEAGEAADGTGNAAPLTGGIALEVAELVYRRGKFSDVTAQLDFAADAIAVDSLSATPYQGKLMGNVQLSRGALPVECKVDLVLDGIEARILDDTAFSKPRNFHGTLDGTIDLSFLAGGGVQPMKHMNGQVELTGSKGSFGEIAVVTQLLTVLRATEVLYLRMPNLRDQGLAYDRFEGQVAFQDGVAALSKFEAENPTLYMSLNGTMDFPKDEADLKAQVALLAGVPGLVEKVGLGGLAGGMRDAASVRARITGSPTSPKVEVTMVGEALKKGVEAVTGTAGAGLRAVGAGAGAVKDVTGGLVGGILGGGGQNGVDSERQAEQKAGSDEEAATED